jgi:hypothetical protein
MGDDMIGAVTTLTGRHVNALMSDNHLVPDLAIECFVLAPNDGGRPESFSLSEDGSGHAS